MSATVISPRFADHQRLTRSGVVQALYTSRRGASNSRVIMTWVSLGSVTTARLLSAPAAILLLLLLKFLQHDIDRGKAIVPRVRVLADPGVDWLECPAVEPVEPLAAVLTDVHGSDLTKDAQVL